MSQLMGTKAAGFVTAMVLSLAPALIMFLNDASDEGLITVTSAGFAVLVINSVVKFMQIQNGEKDRIFRVAPQAAMSPFASSEPSKLKRFLFG